MEKTQNIIKQLAKNHLEITQDGHKEFHQCSKHRKTSRDREGTETREVMRHRWVINTADKHK